jgi:hypothetical protein
MNSISVYYYYATGPPPLPLCPSSSKQEQRQQQIYIPLMNIELLVPHRRLLNAPTSLNDVYLSNHPPPITRRHHPQRSPSITNGVVVGQ